MLLARSFIRKIVADVASGTIRLYHGTDAESADDIAGGGASEEKIREFSGIGDVFWLTDNDFHAEYFAIANPRGSDAWKVLAFDVPVEVLEKLKAKGLAEESDWEGSTVVGLKGAAIKWLASNMTPSVVKESEEALEPELVASARAFKDRFVKAA